MEGLQLYNGSLFSISYLMFSVPPVVRYRLRRDGTAIVYDGPDTVFIDQGLTPGRVYAYEVQSYITSYDGTELASPWTPVSQFIPCSAVDAGGWSRECVPDP